MTKLFRILLCVAVVTVGCKSAPKPQMIPGNLPKFAADGSIVDSGVSVVFRPLMHVDADVPTSNEVSEFMNQVHASCPEEYKIVDVKHLCHPHMSYKDTFNCIAQMECQRKKPMKLLIALLAFSLSLSAQVVPIRVKNPIDGPIRFHHIDRIEAFIPNATVYIQTPQGVNAYTSSSGQLAPVAGSPFPVTGQMEAAVGGYLISVDSAYLHSYPIASGGGIGSETANVDTANYSGGECGQTFEETSLAVDKTGDVYTQLGPAPDLSCTAWQGYQIAAAGTANEGQFTFLNDLVGQWSDSDGNPLATSTPVFDSTNQFAYGFDYELFPGDDPTLYIPVVVPFSKDGSGNLTYNANFTEADPTPDPNLDYYLVPVDAVADGAGHLAVLLGEWFYDDLGPAAENSQLASYSIDPKTGAISTSNTQDNAPMTGLTNGWLANSMSMSLGGQFVAVSSFDENGGYGMQVFNFNGSDPPTALTGVLLPTTEIDQMAWDMQGNLYALSEESEELFVYTVTVSGATPVSGSPYSLAEASGLVVSQ